MLLTARGRVDGGALMALVEFCDGEDANSPGDGRDRWTAWRCALGGEALGREIATGRQNTEERRRTTRDGR